MRNKAVLVLIVLIVLGTIIGLIQNHYSATGRSWFLQDTISCILTPINRAAHWVGNGFSNFFGIFRRQSTLLSENNQLREEIKKLKMENSGLREESQEYRALRQVVGLKQASPMKTIVAEIISRKVSSWFDSATLNVGSTGGIKLGSAVFNHIGLMGQITEVNPLSSQVVFLTEPKSAVGGLVERSRSMGLVRGQGSDDLILTYLPKDADIKNGDVVVSSGKGQVIPKGLPIGRVVSVFRDEASGITSAVVHPSVSFDKAEQVLIAGPGQGVAQ